MPSRKRHRSGSRYPANIFNALDGARRVAWWKYYKSEEEAAALQVKCDVLTDRIETLLPELTMLLDAVLRERNVVAFQRAYRIQMLIDEYHRGQRHPA